MDQCEWANGTDEKTGWNAKIVVIFSIWKIYRLLVSAFRHTSYFVRIFFLSSPIASSHLDELWPQWNCLNVDVDLHIEHKHTLLLFYCSYYDRTICLRIQFFPSTTSGYSETQCGEKNPIPFTNFSLAKSIWRLNHRRSSIAPFVRQNDMFRYEIHKL